jgi:Tol biopolymer transport system component
MRRLVFLLLCLPLCLSIAFPVAAACDQGGYLYPINVRPDLAGGNHGAGSYSMSSDGRYVAFVSQASDLVPGDVNGFGDVFIRDLITCETTLVSVTTAGAPINGSKIDSLISPDGRYVVFATTISQTAYGPHQLMLRDRLLGTTTAISPGEARFPTFTTDMREIAFVSPDSTLVPNDNNNSSDIFFLNRDTNTITMPVPNLQSGSQFPVLSADGRYLAFISGDDQLTADDLNGKQDIFLLDRQLHVVTRVTAVWDAHWVGFTAVDMSADGRYVVYQLIGYITLSAAEEGPGPSSVHVYDRVTGETSRVDVSAQGYVANAPSFPPTISDDGRYVAFQTLANNLVMGDIGDGHDVYVRDLLAHKTYLVSVWPNGRTMTGFGPHISGNGRWIVFSSWSSFPGEASQFNNMFALEWSRVPYIELQNVNLILNGEFENGASSWTPYGGIDHQLSGSRLEFDRTAVGGVMLQNTQQPFAANTVLETQFHLGNSSSVRKRVVVLLHDANFSDLYACSFWLTPRQPLRPYTMRTHTNEAWQSAVIAFYPSGTAGGNGLVQLDSVMLRDRPNGNARQTDCIEPMEFPTMPGTDSVNLLANADFSQPIGSAERNWGLYGQIRAAVRGGSLEISRLAGVPSGVVLQNTGVATPAYLLLEATFQLANTTSQRLRATVLLHDRSFTDLAVCTFWIPPNSPMQTYAMRMQSTTAWAGTSFSLYPATITASGGLQLDNVTLRQRPTLHVDGTSCYEPGAVPAEVEFTAAQVSLIAPTLAPTATPATERVELPPVPTLVAPSEEHSGEGLSQE